MPVSDTNRGRMKNVNDGRKAVEILFFFFSTPYFGKKKEKIVNNIVIETHSAAYIVT